ncbi:MAG: GNAT family N-acetyltransferase [Kiritimatiellae bacterium]|nr:GNAT family N-acetyltransferase [Kiritimatiellia bacterium]
MLPGGEQLLIRSLEAGDAAAAIWLMRKAAGETAFLMRESEECGMTIAQEQAYIARMNDSPREALLGAFVGGELTGMANVSQIAPRARVRHRATIGIASAKAYWGRGIGTAMMRALISLAKEAGYEQIELDVVDNNTRAVALYTRLGFEAVGKIPNAMKYRDGRYANLCLMIRQLGKECCDH